MTPAIILRVYSLRAIYDQTVISKVALSLISSQQFHVSYAYYVQIRKQQALDVDNGRYVFSGSFALHLLCGITGLFLIISSCFWKLDVILSQWVCHVETYIDSVWLELQIHITLSGLLPLRYQVFHEFGPNHRSQPSTTIPRYSESQSQLTRKTRSEAEDIAGFWTQKSAYVEGRIHWDPLGPIV